MRRLLIALIAISGVLPGIAQKKMFEDGLASGRSDVQFYNGQKQKK